jgi:ethanolamine utilization protein EutA
VLDAISAYAGEFVVATAGPDLESVLAARGSGAVTRSEETGRTVLHMDIGGGTANLALIENGKITGTGCMNVGGRLLKIQPDGRIAYVSPVLKQLFRERIGDYVNRNQVMDLARVLANALEMAAGLREKTELLDQLITPGTKLPKVPEGTVFSFSGGVADCIGEDRPWLSYGDMGPELGKAIRESKLCGGEFFLGRETIRATVIGAGCHCAQLSGSTVFWQNVKLPMKNLPVVEKPEELAALDGPGVLALRGARKEGYEGVTKLAQEILHAHKGGDLILALEQDMAKALGQQLALRLGRSGGVLCIDRVKLRAGDYLDVGLPVGPAFPVVVKTLVLNT